MRNYPHVGAGLSRLESCRISFRGCELGIPTGGKELGPAFGGESTKQLGLVRNLPTGGEQVCARKEAEGDVVGSFK